MTDEEQAAFARNPFAGDAIKLRRWDDAGKDEDLSGQSLNDYLDAVEASLSNPSTSKQTEFERIVCDAARGGCE